ncbi:uncharacterized protein TEOVI_000187300 [Trypanosoma equiperdum]|uniref:Variant surface glycoprotein (VSG) n=1 Tax=Trypanosoma equiperdum TaxID=5694 RepID=A0A1G4IDC2_TRYEQ|nr:hypothetical protein, conserved [Trypanosoma equiperdum]
MAQGKAKPYEKPATTNLGEQQDALTKCGTVTAVEQKIIPAKAHIAAVICEAMKAAKTQLYILDSASGDALSADNNFKEAVKNLLMKPIGAGDPEEPATSQAITAMIKTTFESTAEELINKFITAVNNMPVNFKESKQETKSTIGSLVGTPAIGNAISYLEGRKKKIQEVQSQNVSPKVAEAECKDRTNDDCRDENGCVFKDEKCQAKVTTKAGTDEKTKPQEEIML